MTEYVPQELVNAFIRCAADHFQALERRCDLVRSLETHVLGQQGMRPVRPEHVGNRFFLLKLKLAADAFSVIIAYGGRDHDMACFISRKGFKSLYALQDWLHVSDRSALLEDYGGWVLAPDRVEAVLAQYERILEILLPIVIAAGPALELQLEERRQEYLRQDSQEWAQREHVRLAAKADGAFRRKDYKAVVEALSAVRVELTAGERAKLTYARKKLGE